MTETSPDMRRAALGSVVFLVLAPGTVAGLVPWLISGWRLDSDVPLSLRVLGGGCVAVGFFVVVAAFAHFVLEGRGTPAPVAPTEQLVVGGLYRWVRNPMYLAVGSMIAGQAVLFASGGVLMWLVVFAVSVWSFVTFYEEPTLAQRYGPTYAAYRSAVPGWLPRLTPYRADDDERR